MKSNWCKKDEKNEKIRFINHKFKPEKANKRQHMWHEAGIYEYDIKSDLSTIDCTHYIYYLDVRYI